MFVQILWRVATRKWALQVRGLILAAVGSSRGTITVYLIVNVVLENTSETLTEFPFSLLGM